MSSNCEQSRTNICFNAKLKHRSYYNTLISFNQNLCLCLIQVHAVCENFLLNKRADNFESAANYYMLNGLLLNGFKILVNSNRFFISFAVLYYVN